jgi:hypothetical protein
VFEVTVEACVAYRGSESFWERDLRLPFAPFPGLSIDGLCDNDDLSPQVEFVSWDVAAERFRVYCLDLVDVSAGDLGPCWRPAEAAGPVLQLVSPEDGD